VYKGPAETVMQFFRRRPKLGWVALLALAMQLGASFGHIHAGPVRASRAGHDATALACRTFFRPAPDQPCPPSHSDDKGCPICWTMILAGSLVVHDAPTLVLPAFSAESPQPAPARTLAPSVATAAFQARAPPSLRHV
jgi:hypothetical protein